jgi:DNA-binding MurR/RpiR family transcriptional regulator
LGYSGYREFGLALAASGSTIGVVEVRSEIRSGDSLVGIVRKVFVEESRALAQASKTLKIELLEKAVNALMTARQIYCYAVGSASLLASVAEYRFVRLGLSCISVRDPIQMAVQTSLLSPKDVVLAFSQTGRNRDSVDGLLLAREAGATTIGITSEPGSPLVKASDIPLVLFEAGVDSRGALLDAKIAELTLIDALTTCIEMRKSSTMNELPRVDKQIEAIMIRPTPRRSRIRQHTEKE